MFTKSFKRIREEQLFFEAFPTTSFFYIEGMVGIGKTKFVFDLIEPIETLGYTFRPEFDS